MKWRRVLAIVGIVLAVEIVLFVGGFFAVMYAGFYNVAATSPHFGITRWVLGTTMDRSVRYHAAGIPVSKIYGSPDLTVGYDHFSQMCVGCHSAPGVERSEAGEGLNPTAPDLPVAANDLRPSEVYWIVKNGIKMTGMPAFGPTHDDEKLWNITAFVKRLPGVSPEQYREMGPAPHSVTQHQ